MSATIGVLIAHGIGKQKPGFSRALQKRLTKRLGKLGIGSEEIAFQEVYYQDVLQPKQDFYLEHAKEQRIDNKFMRGFVLDILADASMYGFPGREDAPSVVLKFLAARRLRHPQHDTVVVLVEAIVRGRRIPMTGAASVNAGVERASILATLQATNAFVSGTMNASDSNGAE